MLSRSAYQPPRELPFPDHVQKDLAAGPLALELMSERRFAVPDDGAVLTGAIDRLVLMTRDGRPLAADIIDFKTDDLDTTDPAAIDRRVEHYRPQMRSYVRAICHVYGLPEERVCARLVMLGTERVVEVR
ncbi:MAG TPA: PD-(D/E)XK nuclease family protein, partial [Planctomycetaceae bacterium]